MNIETDDYITATNFAKKVKASLQLVRYHGRRLKLGAVLIDGIIFFPKKSVKNWPPEHDKMGRKPKQLTRD